MSRRIPMRPALCVAQAPLLGALAGLSSAQSVVYDLPGHSVSEYFGRVADEAGDVDSDGVNDVIVQGIGSFRVYSGATSQIIHGYGLSSGAVSSAGDVDFDGHADFINGVSSGPAGSAFVYSGATGDLILSMYGDSSQDEFGAAVNDCGDVNGDGYPDLVIGDTADEAAPGASGSAIICSGLDGSRIHVCPAFDQNEFFGENSFGAYVDGVGDQDLDGIPDIVAGPVTTPLLCYVFSGWTGEILHTLSPAQGDSGGLQSLVGTADVSGDGVPEIVLGAPYSDNPTGSVGSVDTILGGTAQVLAQVFGTIDLGQFGHRVSGRHDQDGDGIADLTITSFTKCDGFVCGSFPGSATIVSGADWHVIAMVSGQLVEDEFGSSIVNLGDVNGDGFGEFAVGAMRASYYVGSQSGMMRVFSAIDMPFTVNDVDFELAAGGQQTLRLKAGAQNGGALYAVLGSITGIAPGVELGLWHLPLNPDAYTLAALTPGATALSGYLGLLGLDGKANCYFTFPSGLGAELGGLSLQHAYALLDPLTGAITMTSNSVPLTLLPY